MFISDSGIAGLAGGMSMSKMSARPQRMMQSRMKSRQAPKLQLLQDVKTIRTDFRETWLWSNVTSGFVLKIHSVLSKVITLPRPSKYSVSLYCLMLYCILLQVFYIV